MIQWRLCLMLHEAIIVINVIFKFIIITFCIYLFFKKLVF